MLRLLVKVCNVSVTHPTVVNTPESLECLTLTSQTPYLLADIQMHFYRAVGAQLLSPSLVSSPA